MTDQIPTQFLQNSSAKTQFQKYNFPQSSKNLNSKNQSNKENFTNDQFSFQASHRVESQNSKQSQVLANLLENEQNKKYFSIFSKNGLQSSQKKSNQNISQPTSTITYQQGFEKIENKYKKQSQNSENVSPRPYLQPSVQGSSKDTPQILSQKVNFSRNFNRQQQPENQFEKKKQNLLSQINNNLNYTGKLEKFSSSQQNFVQSIGQQQINQKNQDQLFYKKNGENAVSNTNQFSRNYSSYQSLQQHKDSNNAVVSTYQPNFNVKKFDFGQKYEQENNQLLQQQQPLSQLKNRYLSPEGFQQQEQRRTSLQQQYQMQRNSYQSIPEKINTNYYTQQQNSEFDRNLQIKQLNNNPFLKNNNHHHPNIDQQIYMNSEENQFRGQQQYEQQQIYQNFQQMQNPIEFNKQQYNEYMKQLRLYTPQISQQNKQFPYQEQQYNTHFQQQQQLQNYNNFQKFQTPSYQNNQHYQYQTPSSQFHYQQYNEQEQMMNLQQKQISIPSEKTYKNDNFTLEFPQFQNQQKLNQQQLKYQNIQFQDQNTQIPLMQQTDKIYTPRKFNLPTNQQYTQQTQQQQFPQQFHQQNPNDQYSTAFLNNYFSKNSQKNQQNFQNPSNIQNQINPVDFAKNLNLESEQQQEVVIFLECLQEKLKIEKEISNIKKELSSIPEFSIYQIFKLFDYEKYGIINCENFTKGVNQYFDQQFTKQEALKILRRNCQSDYDPKLNFQEFSEIFIDKDFKIIGKQQINNQGNAEQFDINQIKIFQNQVSNLFNKILKSEEIQEKLKKKVSKGSKLIDILQFSGNNIYY